MNNYSWNLYVRSVYDCTVWFGSIIVRFGDIVMLGIKETLNLGTIEILIYSNVVAQSPIDLAPVTFEMVPIAHFCGAFLPPSQKYPWLHRLHVSLKSLSTLILKIVLPLPFIHSASELKSAIYGCSLSSGMVWLQLFSFDWSIRFIELSTDFESFRLWGKAEVIGR